MAAQRSVLDTMLSQWENAIMYGNQNTPNEVHIVGDTNLNSLKGKWLEPNYHLVTLARMVMDCCNTNNFAQMVNNITRVQYNSVKKETVTSCIDHIYCNTKHRMSAVKIITCGAIVML